MNRTVALLVAANFVGGCVVSAHSSQDEGASSDEAAVSAANRTFLTPVDDPALKFELRMLDGTKSTTKNQRFIKMTAWRGKEHFPAWCDASGELSIDAGTLTSISCSVFGEDEALRLTFEREQTSGSPSYSLSIAQIGDGTLLEDEVSILVGDGDLSEGAIMLKVKAGKNPVRDPFALASYVEGALSPVLSQIGAPISRIDYALDDSMNLTIGSYKGSVSILDVPGSLSGGLAKATMILERASSLLSGPGMNGKAFGAECDSNDQCSAGHCVEINEGCGSGDVGVCEEPFCAIQSGGACSDKCTSNAECVAKAAAAGAANPDAAICQSVCFFEGARLPNVTFQCIETIED